MEHSASDILVYFLSCRVIRVVFDSFEAFEDVVLDKVGMKSSDVVFHMLVVCRAEVSVDRRCEGS
jgi:hypothetical protein